jgi:hypothetical protein
MDVTGLPPAVICNVVDVVAGAVWVDTTTEVVAVRDPDVPVMVTVVDPVDAVELAVSVITLVPAPIGLGEKAALTPLGKPVAAKLTLPLNPF